MKDSYFIDTNIFIYAFDKSSDEKRTISNKLIREGLNSGKGIVSYQVLQEFLNVATRKFEKPLSISDCQNYLINVLEPLCEVFASTGLYYQALEISNRWKYSFYDSLIIGAAISADCRVLYTEDLQDGQKIDGLTIVNPFN